MDCFEGTTHVSYKLYAGGALPAHSPARRATERPAGTWGSAGVVVRMAKFSPFALADPEKPEARVWYNAVPVPRSVEVGLVADALANLACRAGPVDCTPLIDSDRLQFEPSIMQGLSDPAFCLAPCQCACASPALHTAATPLLRARCSAYHTARASRYSSARPAAGMPCATFTRATRAGYWPSSRLRAPRSARPARPV